STPPPWPSASRRSAASPTGRCATPPRPRISPNIRTTSPTARITSRPCPRSSPSSARSCARASTRRTSSRTRTPPTCSPAFRAASTSCSGSSRRTRRRRPRSLVPLQVRVPRQPVLVHLQELARLLDGHALGPHGVLGGAAQALHQLVPVVAHVLQHVGHRVPRLHVLDAIPALVVEHHVHG